MKILYEVHIPYPSILVYYIEAESPEEAIEIAQTPGTLEDHSIGGCLEAPKVFTRKVIK